MQSRGMPDEDTLNLSSLGASATKQRDLERLLLKADERNICKYFPPWVVWSYYCCGSRLIHLYYTYDV